MMQFLLCKGEPVPYSDYGKDIDETKEKQVKQRAGEVAKSIFKKSNNLWPVDAQRDMFRPDNTFGRPLVMI